jgi:hypothetical protein
MTSEFLLNFLQWPAMIATLVSAWLVASQTKFRRSIGFWIFILSNILWVAWGIETSAYALIFMQIGLLIMNIRGIYKNKGMSK